MKLRKFLIVPLALAFLTSCAPPFTPPDFDTPYAPGLKRGEPLVDPFTVGNRLIDAGEYELAFQSYERSVLDKGLTPGVLAAMASAQLGMGRLNQAEKLLRRALKQDKRWPELWNNLGVVLTEQGKFGEAAETFKLAYALDKGESNTIRDNLKHVLLELDKAHTTDLESDYEYELEQINRGLYRLTEAQW